MQPNIAGPRISHDIPTNSLKNKSQQYIYSEEHPAITQTRRKTEAAQAIIKMRVAAILGAKAINCPRDYANALLDALSFGSHGHAKEPESYARHRTTASERIELRDRLKQVELYHSR